VAKSSASPSGPPGKAKISVAAGGSDNAEGSSTSSAGMAVFGYIAGGILVWSLIGWGLDNLFKTQWMVVGGALLGLIGGMYLSFAPRFRHRQVKEDLAEAEGSAGKTTDQS
jgi:ATP synthase protein I